MARSIPTVDDSIIEQLKQRTSYLNTGEVPAILNHCVRQFHAMLGML